MKAPQKSPSKTGVTKNGEQKVVKNLLKQVSDTFQALRSKVSALLSTLQRPRAKRAGKAAGKQFVAQPKTYCKENSRV
jgi:hypothetical protein